jgi:hypothetical protein
MKLTAALFALMLAANASAQTVYYGDSTVTWSTADPGYQIECDCQDLQQWHLTKNRAREAWTINNGTQSFKVGVLGSGIDTLGYDFGLYLYGGNPGPHPNIWTNPNEVYDGIDNDSNGVVDDVHGANFTGATPTGIVQDGWGQGTILAGVMAAEGPSMAFRGVGVVPNITIVPIKVTESFVADAAAVPDGLAYARSVGCKIVVGTGGTNAVHQPTKDQIALNTAAGMLTVWSAGAYSGGDIDRCPEPCELPGSAYPAKHSDPGLLVVADGRYVTASGMVHYSANSNYGTTSVDIHAPVNNTSSSNGGIPNIRTVGLDNAWWDVSGGGWTSTAQVAGAAAMIWGANPELTAAQVKAFIMDYGQPKGLSAYTVTGKTLDVKASLDAANASGPLETEGAGDPLVTPVARPADGKTYDVQGRRVDSDYKGVRFVNGRKRVGVKP